MGRSRRGRVASSGGASSVVGERGTMTEKRNLYLYLYLDVPHVRWCADAVVSEGVSTLAVVQGFRELRPAQARDLM